MWQGLHSSTGAEIGGDSPPGHGIDEVVTGGGSDNPKSGVAGDEMFTIDCIDVGA